MSIPLGVRYYTGHWENTDSRAEWLCPQERNHRHASLCDIHWPWSPCLTLWMSRLFASFPEAVTSCWTLECFPCFQALTTQQGLCALCVRDKLALGADISQHSVICSVRLQPCLLCLPPMGRLSRLPGGHSVHRHELLFLFIQPTSFLEWFYFFQSHLFFGG